MTLSVYLSVLYLYTRAFRIVPGARTSGTRANRTRLIAPGSRSSTSLSTTIMRSKAHRVDDEVELNPKLGQLTSGDARESHSSGTVCLCVCACAWYLGMVYGHFLCSFG